MKRFLILGLMISNSYAETINEKVTQENIMNTICITNYSRTIRPSTNYTNKIKLEKLKMLGLSENEAKYYELDHNIPISSGGNPDDPENLILQPLEEAKLKDRLEVKIHKEICNGNLSLSDGQKVFKNNWKDSYNKYFTK
jgi:hypothetical protein